MYAAAQNGDVEALHVLKELGADVNTPNKNGATPVYIAAYLGKVDAIQALAQFGADVNIPQKWLYPSVYCCL